MTKERLEEIRKRTWIHVHIGKDTTAEMPKEDMEYLHERVRELEEEVGMYHEENIALSHELLDAVKQNRKIKESRERIFKKCNEYKDYLLIGNAEGLQEALSIIDEALEESE